MISFSLISFRIKPISSTSIGVSSTISYFKKNVLLFGTQTENLITLLELINKNDTLSVYRAREGLKKCRLSYKNIEFFTEYFFYSETHMYNATSQVEVEEPTLEYIEPLGLQQIESLLFEKDVYDVNNKKELLVQAKILSSSVKDLNSLLYNFQADDRQILESLRIELVRMITLSLSGADAMYLKSGITETLQSTTAIQFILKPYIAKNPEKGIKLDSNIENSLEYLRNYNDFDSFNRMEYITKFALPLQKELGDLIKSLGLQLNTSKYLNYDENIFSTSALNDWESDVDPVQKQKLTSLGEKFFFEKRLSGNLNTSCATCHQPENFFSDLLPKSQSLNPDSVLKRNTPTLLYAGWQHVQFWDGRASSLQEQIKEVIFNPLEMNGKKELVYKNVLLNNKYQVLLQEAFSGKKVKDLNIDNIALAISMFVKQLNPMNSPFDRYIKGEKDAMSESQINGFNLFMGKAQCGTCHFAPYFNSLLPPLYDISEMEVIGTPLNDNLDYPINDNDLGRFNLYRTPYYKRAFKTPTVRNTEKTAPYMHNGSFNSLELVLEFYNKGGGKGLGLNIENQSLSSSPLNLSKKEMNDIIQFIYSLTDSNIYKKSNYLN